MYHTDRTGPQSPRRMAGGEEAQVRGHYAVFIGPLPGGTLKNP